MKFFINYYRAFRMTGGGNNAIEQATSVKFKEIFEAIIIGCALALVLSFDSGSVMGFYYLDFILYSAAYLSFRVVLITSRSCKYRISDLMPSDYKKRVVGEYVNGAIMFVQMVVFMCLIYSFAVIIYLLLDAQQTFINLSQSGVEVAFKISLCIWLASNGIITGRISSFVKRFIYSIAVLLVTIGASVLIYYASAVVNGIVIFNGAAVNFAVIPHAALWLILAYAISIAAFIVSVIVTINSEKPKAY